MANLSAQGPIALHGATSVLDSTAKNKLGTRASDVDGNVYVYVQFSSTVYQGEWVSFTAGFVATKVGAATRGWVGVVIPTATAASLYGWVQVYGVNTYAFATTSTSSGNPVTLAATTDIGAVDSIATTTGTLRVYGVLVASSPDSCATTALSSSAVSANPATVMLNFPFVDGSQGSPIESS